MFLSHRQLGIEAQNLTQNTKETATGSRSQLAKQCPSFLQVFANAAKQYLTADVAAGARTGSSGSTAVRSALQQRRNFYAGNVNLRGDASQQVRLLWAKDTNTI